MLSDEDIEDAFLIDLTPIERFLEELLRYYNLPLVAFTITEIVMEETLYQFYGMGARYYSDPLLDACLETISAPSDVRTELVELLKGFIESKILEYVTKEQRQRFNFEDSKDFGPGLLWFKAEKIKHNNGVYEEC